MNLRVKMKRVVSVLILILLMMISIHKAIWLLRDKSSDQNSAAFFAEDQQIDVLFFGSSHVRNGIFPMELWNDYGIVSYNMGGDGNRIPMAYWRFVNALDYQTPKLVVMDVYGGATEGKVSTLWQTHLSFDCFPLSPNKFRMVRDLFDDENMEDYDKRWELLADFTIYHTRWNALAEGDFDNRLELEKKSAVWKGSLPLARVIPVLPRNNESTVRLNEMNRKYLEDMILLCRDRNIDILFINTGFDNGEESESYQASVRELTTLYDVEYIDLTKQNIVNYETDFYDIGPNAHVNFIGAEKLTDFIGTVISDKYNIGDHRNGLEYSDWWEAYQNFVESKAGYLRGQTELDVYLMFMTDKNYDAVIEIMNKDIFDEGQNRFLLENLGVDLERIDQDINFLTIDCAEKEANYLSAECLSGTLLDSNIGTLGIQIEGEKCSSVEGSYGVYLDNAVLYTATPTESINIRITVIGRDNGEIIDVHTF